MVNYSSTNAEEIQTQSYYCIWSIMRVEFEYASNTADSIILRLLRWSGIHHTLILN